MVSVGVHLLRICGRRFKRSIPSLLDLLGCIVHTTIFVRNSVQSFSNLWLPKTSQIHGQGALEVLLSFTIAKMKDCSYLEMAWSFSTTSLLFLNFQCLQILSIYHAPPENTTMKPTPMIFWKPEFPTSISRNFPLFPASKFLCCWMGNIPCRYIPQIRRLSSVQSSARSIVWYVSSYSSTSAVPRWIAFFHGVTVVELNKGIWLMDFHLKSSNTPCIEWGGTAWTEEFWQKVAMFNKDFDTIKPMAWQLIVTFLGCFWNI